MTADIRWTQRLANFKNALAQLNQAVELGKKRPYTDLERQGLIQAFEFTHELAWKLLKDYLDFQGNSELITGSRDAAREAFKRSIISDGEVWMKMIESRNLTSHTYNVKVAQDISNKITSEYVTKFQSLQQTMEDFENKLKNENK